MTSRCYPDTNDPKHPIYSSTSVFDDRREIQKIVVVTLIQNIQVLTYLMTRKRASRCYPDTYEPKMSHK